ncbi:hypothetical protein [Streptomyces sp. NBC_00470]
MAQRPKRHPGAVDMWVCAPVADPIEFAVSDDFHNYAITDRFR